MELPVVPFAERCLRGSLWPLHKRPQLQARIEAAHLLVKRFESEQYPMNAMWEAAASEGLLPEPWLDDPNRRFGYFQRKSMVQMEITTARWATLSQLPIAPGHLADFLSTVPEIQAMEQAVQEVFAPIRVTRFVWNFCHLPTMGLERMQMLFNPTPYRILQLYAYFRGISERWAPDAIRLLLDRPSGKRLAPDWIQWLTLYGPKLLALAAMHPELQYVRGGVAHLFLPAIRVI